MSVTLVSGAGGMIGSHMVELLHQDGFEVIGTYYKPTVDIKEINPGITMIECDVRYPKNIEKIILKYCPKEIYHLAAQSYPTVSWNKPYETMDINVNGTIGLFESIKECRKIKKDYDPIVVVACSSAEYGSTLDNLQHGEKVNENASLLPLHPYGVSKVAQDLLSYQYFKNDNIKTIRARIFNTTGTRKVNDVISDFTKRAIEIEKSGERQKKLRVGNIETYRAIMDFRDLVSALRLLAEKGEYGEVYNICSEQVYKIADIISLIEKQMKQKYELYIDSNLLRPTDEKTIIGDISKLKRDTGWSQTIQLENTIIEMLDYWRKKL